MKPPVLLAIDVGNTNTVFALYRADRCNESLLFQGSRMARFFAFSND
jgi:pantothenate kinase type III